MTSTLDETEALDGYLAPTWFLDADDPDVRAFAAETCAAAGASTDREKAVALFVAVRDGWRYNPYTSTRVADDYRASTVLHRPEAYCIPKAGLLTALCRAEGIPARLGFADVRNHLQSEQLIERMGTDVFVFHGYSEILIDGQWRKASSAFNKELCERFGTKVLEFDGTSDAILHAFDESGNQHMEYVRQRGSYADLPFDEIMATFDEVYGGGLLDRAPADTPADEAFTAE